MLLVVVLISYILNAQKIPAVTQYVPQYVSIDENLEYVSYEDRKLYLDLYRPNDYSGILPTIVVIRGGGFRVGDKKGFASMAAALAKEGFATVCIEYRTLDEAKFPGAVFDAKSAVKWVKEHAASYHLNPDAIGVIGGSAGALLSMTLAVSNHVEVLNPTSSFNNYKVNAAVVLEADADFLTATDDKNLIEWLGATFEEDPDLWKLASPIYHIDSTSVPMLFIHGTEDTIVPIDQTTNSIDRLIASNVYFEFISLPHVGHSFWGNPKYFEFTIKKAAQFFKEQLKH